MASRLAGPLNSYGICIAESLHPHPPRFPIVQQKRGVVPPVQEQFAVRKILPPGEARQPQLQEQLEARILHLSPSEFSVASGRPMLTQSIAASSNGAAPQQQPQESSGTVLAKAFRSRRMKAGTNNESAHLLVLERLTSFGAMVSYADKLDTLALQTLAKTLLTFSQTVRTSGQAEDVRVSRLAAILYLFTRRGFPSGLKNNLAELLSDDELWPADIDDLRPECVERWQNVQPCTPQRKIVQDIVLRLYGNA
ncbi:hypothetical protein [Variovorax sp. DT-64]|uniref:hypothetical protein n=1 Tax=Variovorax sp. DT-64 TaxID=3396160 RepID=UPI003F1DA003